MKSDLDFLNESLATPAPAPASPETPLPTLPLDHPLYATLAPLLETLSLAQQAPESLDDEAIEQLLRKMEDTELAADGLEERLDQLLGTLDGMLGALEPLEKKVEEGKKDEKEVVEKEK